MKFRYLDGLRGVAALIVVFNHLMFMFVPFAINAGGTPHGLGPLLHNTPLFLLVDGDLAVCVFFVLSGFVLSAKFFRTGESGVVVASAVKRYFRLGIPVLGSVLVAFVLLRLGLMFNAQAGALTSDWWKNFWQFAPNLRDAVYEGAFGAFKNDGTVYNPVLWTMRLELWGSFLVFGSLLIFGKLRNRWVLYGVLALLLWRTYYPAFVLGVAACDYYFNRPEGVLRQGLERGWWVAVLAVALLIGSYPITELKGTVWAYVPGFWPVQAHTIAAIGIVVAILSSRGLQRALSTRMGRFLGRISFPLYLLHMLVLGSYTSYLFVHLSRQMSLKAAMLVAVLPTLAICISAAYVFAKYVDEPAIRFSGWMFARFFGGKAPEKKANFVADSDPAPVQMEATARNT